MTIIGNTNILHSNQQTGRPQDNVLDVTDSIIDMTPWDVPLLSMTQRGPKPKDRVVHWRVDYGGQRPTSMGQVDTFNEGDDHAPSALDDHIFLKNNLHLVGKSYSVSHTMEELEEYGLDSRIDYEAAKCSKDLLRQVCFAAMNSTIDNQSTTPNAGSLGQYRKMGGIREQIMTPANFQATGTLPTGAKAYNKHITTDLSATSGALTVAMLNDAMGDMWNNGGIDGDVIYGLANRTVKAVVSELFAPSTGSSSVYRRTFGGGVQPINLKVDVIETEYADIHMVLDWTVKEADAGTSATTSDDEGDLVFIQPEYVELCVLQDFNQYELAKVGSSYKFAQEWEGTIKLKAPNTAGILRGILT